MFPSLGNFDSLYEGSIKHIWTIMLSLTITSFFLLVVQRDPILFLRSMFAWNLSFHIYSAGASPDKDAADTVIAEMPIPGQNDLPPCIARPNRKNWGHTSYGTQCNSCLYCGLQLQTARTGALSRPCVPRIAAPLDSSKSFSAQSCLVALRAHVAPVALKTQSTECFPRLYSLRELAGSLSALASRPALHGTWGYGNLHGPAGGVCSTHDGQHGQHSPLHLLGVAGPCWQQTCRQDRWLYEIWQHCTSPVVSTVTVRAGSALLPAWSSRQNHLAPAA